MPSAELCNFFSKNVAADQQLLLKVDMASSQRDSHNRSGVLVYGLESVLS